MPEACDNARAPNDTALIMTHPEYILTLSCIDQRGIVLRVAGFLAEHGCNIIDSAQFGDPESQLFFMRVHFALEDAGVADADLRGAFAALCEANGMRGQLHDAGAKPRVLIMVSKIGHCLNDLLFRHRLGALPIDIRAVVSNHADFARLVGSYEIPFHHWPVEPGTKGEAEGRLVDLLERERIELVVLARYMQVLSPDLCRRLEGKAINIHHSFLPSFKGARPYHQAAERGVKVIGATAHYVTADLDEGPIIEQDTARVDHTMDAAALTAIGRDTESAVLARAVLWHAERRVLVDGRKTVVFR